MMLFAGIFFCVAGLAQTVPFQNDIDAFRQADKEAFPGTGKVLLVGSSSFTNWKDVQDYFPAVPIINRGFGGSSLTDLIRFKDELLDPYQPRQIIIYCGENDFAGNPDLKPKEVYKRFKTFFEIVRSKYPAVPVDYISMKPSPSRMFLFDKFKKTNRRIERYIRRKPNARFINVFDAMLNADGRPKPEIFVSDSLHMNAAGYRIWQGIMDPYLKRN